ncbi:hypothetical protein V6N13_057326 [Hibiscus sabdariffa]
MSNGREHRSVRIQKSSDFLACFSLMGNYTDCFFGRVHGVDDMPGSRWCESRSRPPLGRRSVRLEGPIDGCRQPCHLRCQDWNDAHNDGGSFWCGKGSYFPFVLQVPVCCFMSADWYGVRGRCNRGFSDGCTLVSVWLFEGNSDDGLPVFICDGNQVLMLGEVRRQAGSIEAGKIVVIWGNFFKVDGFFDGFVIGQHVWELGMKVLSIEIVQRFCGKGEEGSLVDDWLVVNRVWSWWRYRKKRTYYSGWVCRWFRRRMDWISEEIVGNLPVRFLDKLEGRISIWYWLLGSTGRQNADGRTEFDQKEWWCVIVLGKKMLKSIFGAGSGNRGKRLMVTGMYGLLNSAGGRKTNGIGILGMMSSVSGEGMVWLWWTNHDGWEYAKEHPRWSERLCFGSWWCSWKVRGECVRGKASRRWLWGLVWWSTAESKGWKEEFGDFLGYVKGECMVRRGDTWPITCGKLGPYRAVNFWPGCAGGNIRLEVRGGRLGRRSEVDIWRSGCGTRGICVDDYEDDYGVWMFRRWIITEGAAAMGNIIEGSLTYGSALQMPKEGSLTLGVGRVLFICFGDTKRSILWGSLVGKVRCVFWSRWVGIKRYVLKEEKRCVSRPRWVGVKRGVLEEEKRCVLELITGFDGGGLRTEKRNVWTMCGVNCVPYCLATVSFRMRSCVLKSDSRKEGDEPVLVGGKWIELQRFYCGFFGPLSGLQGNFRGSYMKNLSVLKEFVVVKRESWFVDFFIVLRKVCSVEMGDSVWKKKSQSFTGIVDEFLKFHRHVHGIASKLDRGYERCCGGNGCAGHEMGGKEEFKGRQWWCSWWWLRKSTVVSLLPTMRS